MNFYKGVNNMYFYIDIAKGKRIDHAERQNSFMEPVNKFKTILKGDKCLVFSNGTIGPGALSFNYKKEAAIKLLEKLITELKE